MFSFIPQLWICNCGWSGEYAEIINLNAKIPHPTCPKCREHKFKVRDLPIPGSHQWNIVRRKRRLKSKIIVESKDQ